MSGAKKKLARREAQTLAGLTEREKQELQKQKAQKRNTIIAVVGGVIAVVLIIALLVWNTGFFDRHRTVLKFTPTQGKTSTDVLSLTEADMNYFYYQAINRLAEMYNQAGLDYTTAFDPSGDLKTQYVDADQTVSYYDYFRQQALTDAQETISLYNAAKAAGHTLSEDGQATLDSAKSSLDSAVAQGYGSRTNYLRAIYGRSMTEKVYFTNLERTLLASDYYNSAMETLGNTYTDAELEAYYAEHTDEMDNYVFDYAYFDGTPATEADEEGNTPEPTEEESAAALAQAKEQADAMLAALQSDTTVTVTEPDAGDETGADLQTKDFSTLAETFGSQDYNQMDNSGDNLVGTVFYTWLVDAARADGDADVFELDGTGYYLVQFHSRYRSEVADSADVRHILIATSHEDDPETADVDESQVPFTDEEIAAAQAEAQRILDEFTSGEQTGERFGELAEQYSQDGRNEDGSLASPGGLYEDVTPTTSFVPEFLDWIFAADRKAGDVGIVQTDYGFHVMYAESVEEAHWIVHAREALASQVESDYMAEIKSHYEIGMNKWYPAADQAQASESAEATEDAADGDEAEASADESTATEAPATEAAPAN